MYELSRNAGLLLALGVLSAAGCTLTYDTDELPAGRVSDAGEADGGEASIDAGGDGAGADASEEPPPDAGSEADANSCTTPGEDCYPDDDFVECTAEGTCEACGTSDLPCCEEGDDCVGALGLLCNKTLGLCL